MFESLNRFSPGGLRDRAVIKTLNRYAAVALSLAYRLTCISAASNAVTLIR